jgi:hypothetical protein
MEASPRTEHSLLCTNQINAEGNKKVALSFSPKQIICFLALVQGLKTVLWSRIFGFFITDIYLTKEMKFLCVSGCDFLRNI